jgi:hypothetical protein
MHVFHPYSKPTNTTYIERISPLLQGWLKRKLVWQHSFRESVALNTWKYVYVTIKEPPMWEGAHRMAYRLVRFNRILRLPRTTHYNSQRLLQLWRSIYSHSGARLGTSIGINTSCDVMYLATSPSQPSSPFPDQPKRMTGSTPASPLPPPIHYVQSACATSQQHPWSYDLIFQQLVPGYELLGTRWSEPHAQPGMERGAVRSRSIRKEACNPDT